MNSEQQKCGYIGILGLPNAGKSTFLNACVGQKIAGVSAKPQTTRNRILGVRTVGKSQFLFLDSPGISKKSPKQNEALAKAMDQQADMSLQDSDCVLYLIDVTRGFQEGDKHNLERIKQKSGGSLNKVLVLASKSDFAKKAIVDTNLAAINEALQNLGLAEDKAFLISAKIPNKIQGFLGKLSLSLPTAPWLFAEDDLSDRSENFIVSEMIREQIFRQYSQELPFACSVKVDSIDLKEKSCSIAATIFANKESHRPILLGHQGQNIKKIRQEAIPMLRSHFDCPIRLSLNVKISPNWVNDPARVESFLI